MAIGTRSYARGFLSSSGLPPGIKWLLISNTAIFVFYFFAGRGLRGFFDLGMLRPSDVVTHFYIWQLATYMFLHAGIGHILFNMLALWMFGTEFERLWGTRRFLRFYFFCGMGAGLQPGESGQRNRPSRWDAVRLSLFKGAADARI